MQCYRCFYDRLIEREGISRLFHVYAASYRVTMRFGLRLTADKKKKEGIQLEENAFVTRERRILESRDCERTRVKQGPFDTPLQSRLSRTCRHPIYIYTHLPVSMGPEDVVELRVEQG